MTPLLVAILALSLSVTLALSSAPWRLRLGALRATKSRVACASRRSASMRSCLWALRSVAAAVQLDDLVGRLVQASGAVAQFGVGAAALLAGVGWQLDAVDGE